MDPATIAAIGSGIGSLLGGRKKDADPAYSIALQEQSALRMNEGLFNQKMALAKQHGLHPLTVMGVPSSNFAPAIPLDQPNDYTAIGSGVERIAQSFVKPPEGPAAASEDPTQRRLIDAQVRTAEANANRSEWDALRSQWTTEDLLRGQPGNPPAARISNDGAVTQALAAVQAGVSPRTLSGGGVTLKQDISPPHPSLLGHSMGADQSMQRMVGPDGKLYSMPNPNVYQPDIENFGTFHYLANEYGPDKAMKIMAVLEQAPLAGGLMGTAAAGGYAAYRYFANQRKDAFARRTTRQTWSRSGPGRMTGPRNE